MENKIGFDVPFTDDIKWEAVGRGYASVLMEKQHRVDQLEQMLLCLYNNVCQDTPSVMILEGSDDIFANFCMDILETVRKLKEKQ